MVTQRSGMGRLVPYSAIFVSAAFLGSMLFAALVVDVARASERFPPPEFSTGHELPEQAVAPADWVGEEYLDVAVLIAALGVGSYFALRTRSRRAIFYLTIFSLVYFGFWRKGCVCPIGSIQNVVLGSFHSGYAVPVTVLAFFLIPLVFTLFFGRIFCGGVCPLGAIQDLVLVRSIPVPRWLDQGLRVLAYAYLGLAVLLAATASAFIICQYDPFVGFFRLSASSGMLVLGALFLVVALFIGRPYCRFLCPYGVLLGHVSRLSRWKVRVTPDACVLCNLCKDECPFGAIDAPARTDERSGPVPASRRLAALLALVPILVAVGAWVGSLAAGPLSQANRHVALSERIWLEDSGEADGTTTDPSDAFRATGRPTRELHDQALAIRESFSLGTTIVGAFLGLVVGLKLVRSVIPRRNKDYEARRSACVACGRCYFYCPQEHERLKHGGITLSPESVSRQL